MRLRWKSPRLALRSSTAFVFTATAVLVIATGALAGQATAAASSATNIKPLVTSVADASFGKSPYAGLDCNVPTSAYMASGGKVAEPMIAVNPLNPQNRIVIYEDRTRASVDTAYTMNGGRTWTRSVPEGIDECGGNYTFPWEASGNTWAAFGPDGRAYLSVLVWGHFSTPPVSLYRSVVYTLYSTNGGKTWSKPVLVSAANGAADKPMILADRYRPGDVYVAWDNDGYGEATGPRGASELLFARSTNGGATFGKPIVVDQQPDQDPWLNNQLAELDNGTLVYTTAKVVNGVFDFVAYHSTDGGLKWSAPVVIAPSASPPSTVCGVSYYFGTSQVSQDAVYGNRIYFAAWQATGGVALYWSDDGGSSWQGGKTILSGSPLPIMYVSIGTDVHGNLGVIYDQINTSDLDCSASPDPVIPVRSVFAISTDGGASWNSAVIGAHWWNLATEYIGGTYDLGDFASVATTPSGFMAATAQGDPLTSGGPLITGDGGIIVANVDETR